MRKTYVNPTMQVSETEPVEQLLLNASATLHTGESLSRQDSFWDDGEDSWDDKCQPQTTESIWDHGL